MRPPELRRVHHRHLRRDREAAAQLAQRVHEVVDVHVHADPCAVDEHLRRGGDGGGRDLLQLLHAPGVEEVHDRTRVRPHGDVREEREVLDQPDRLALGRLRRADHPPVRVVQLARLGALALATDGRVEPAQMRERRRVREPVEHLRDARAQRAGRRALRAPVARGEGVLEAVRYLPVPDGRDGRKGLVVVEALLRKLGDVLCELTEELPKELRHERAREVDALVAVVVAILGVPHAD